MICVSWTIATRPHYLLPTLKAWDKVWGKDRVQWLFNVEPTPQKEENLTLINSFLFRNKLIGKIIINESVYGCNVNTKTALRRGFGQADYVVLAEDDLLPSTDVLDMFVYAEKALDWGEPIMSLCCRNGDCRHQSNPNHLVRYPEFTGYLWMTERNVFMDNFVNNWDDTNSGKGGWDCHMSRVGKQKGLISYLSGQTRVQHIGEQGVHYYPQLYKELNDKTFYGYVADRPKGTWTHEPKSEEMYL